MIYSHCSDIGNKTGVELGWLGGITLEEIESEAGALVKLLDIPEIIIGIFVYLSEYRADMLARIISVNYKIGIVILIEEAV